MRKKAFNIPQIHLNKPKTDQQALKSQAEKEQELKSLL